MNLAGRDAMKTLIVYYSLSGMVRIVADELAKALGTDSEEIRCSRYRRGFWGFLRAAYDSSRGRGRVSKVEPLAHTPSECELVVIDGPIWAFHAPPPVRACLRQQAGRLPVVTFS